MSQSTLPTDHLQLRPVILIQLQSQRDRPVKHQHGQPVKDQHVQPVKHQHGRPVKHQHGRPVKHQHDRPVKHQHGQIILPIPMPQRNCWRNYKDQL